MKRNNINPAKKFLTLTSICVFFITMLAACGQPGEAPEGSASADSTQGTSQAPAVTSDDVTSSDQALDTTPEDSASPDQTPGKNMTYDEMVAYLQQKGFIAEDATPVDMNTTAGYLKAEVFNDAFEFQGFENFSDQPWEFASIAKDFDGLYLIWYDPAILEGYDPDAPDQDQKAEAWNNIKVSFVDEGQTEIPSWPLVFEKDSSGDILSYGVIPNLYLNGSSFLIAFSDEYAQKDAAIAEFTAMNK